MDKKDYELAKELRSELELYIGAITTIEWFLTLSDYEKKIYGAISTIEWILEEY